MAVSTIKGIDYQLVDLSNSLTKDSHVSQAVIKMETIHHIATFYFDLTIASGATSGAVLLSGLPEVNRPHQLSVTAYQGTSTIALTYNAQGNLILFGPAPGRYMFELVTILKL